MLQAECARLRRYYDEQLSIATRALAELRSEHERACDELGELSAALRRAELESKQYRFPPSHCPAVPLTNGP